jgi:hypothetical protein
MRRRKAQAQPRSPTRRDPSIIQGRGQRARLAEHSSIASLTPTPSDSQTAATARRHPATSPTVTPYARGTAARHHTHAFRGRRARLVERNSHRSSRASAKRPRREATLPRHHPTSPINPASQPRQAARHNPHATSVPSTFLRRMIERHQRPTTAAAGADRLAAAKTPIDKRPRAFLPSPPPSS